VLNIEKLQPHSLKDLAMYDDNFPSVSEIKLAVKRYIKKECGSRWPEDDWFNISDSWVVNVWRSPKRRITVYREFSDSTDTEAGISIQ
jgi:hypothetical protein